MEQYNYREGVESGEKLNINSLSQLYAEVFAGPPWNEYTKSQVCNTFFGLDTKPGNICPQCGDILQEAYPTQETNLYIKNELKRSHSILATIENEQQIVGFAWGFSYRNYSEFISEKYKTGEMQNQLNSLFMDMNITGSLFYFSECGISPSFRGKGFSNELTSMLITQAQTLQQPLVMRTNYQSPMVYVASKFGMTQIMGPCNDTFINFADRENIDRVLFIKN